MICLTGLEGKIFVFEDGLSIKFRLAPDVPQAISNLIMIGGGTITANDDEHSVFIVPTKESARSLKRDYAHTPFISKEFVEDSFSKKEIQDVNNYITNSNEFHKIDLKSIVLKNKSWIDYFHAETSEDSNTSFFVCKSRVSNGNTIVPLLSANSKVERGTPKISRPYKDSEIQVLIEIVKKHQIHDFIHGNLVWRHLEKIEVLPGRTWQSMKELFFKRILPNGKSWGISEDEMERFKQAKKRIRENPNIKSQIDLELLNSIRLDKKVE